MPFLTAVQVLLQKKTKASVKDLAQGLLSCPGRATFNGMLTAIAVNFRQIDTAIAAVLFYLLGLHPFRYCHPGFIRTYCRHPEFAQPGSPFRE